MTLAGVAAVYPVLVVPVAVIAIAVAVPIPVAIAVAIAVHIGISGVISGSAVVGTVSGIVPASVTPVVHVVLPVIRSTTVAFVSNVA
jgi:hypothetical protein